MFRAILRCELHEVLVDGREGCYAVEICACTANLTSRYTPRRSSPIGPSRLPYRSFGRAGAGGGRGEGREWSNACSWKEGGERAIEDYKERMWGLEVKVQ